MVDFDYLEPPNITEAVAVLNRFGEQAKVIAGGTDLLMLIRQRLVSPCYLVCLRRIPELNFIETAEDGSVRIGASTPFSRIEGSELIKERFGVLAQAIGTIASRQVRNLATIGGNICHASPSADSVPPLLALNATVEIAGPQGKREIALDNFFKGPGETAISSNEILTEIRLPPLPKNSTGAYIKLSPRRAMDLAVVGVAVILVRDEGKGVCEDARIGLGGVAPTAMRSRESERLLMGRSVDRQITEIVAKKASEETKPISDFRASAQYRREMTRVLVERILESLIRES